MRGYVLILSCVFLGLTKAQKSQPKTHFEVQKASYQSIVAGANGQLTYKAELQIKPKIKIYNLRLLQNKQVLACTLKSEPNDSMQLYEAWYSPPYKGRGPEMTAESETPAQPSKTQAQMETIEFDFSQPFDLSYELCSRSKIKNTKSIKIKLRHQAANPHDALPN
jgi:hypothetical protein